MLLPIISLKHPGHLNKRSTVFYPGAKVRLVCPREFVHARVKFVEKCEIDASDITVLQHALKGHTSADIALLTNTTACAVDERFRRLCARMQVRNRKAAITLAYLHGAVF